MLAIFGGTFDPIHNGHLNMAHHACDELNLDTLYFMPCAQPAHKATPGVTAEDRLAMLQLAIADDTRYALDDRELKRTGPSYSVLSLRELRLEHPNEPLAFLIGMDSFNGLHTWYHWQEIVKLCHILVYRRPGEVFSPPEELTEYVTNARVDTPEELTEATGGKLYLLSGPELSASSTEVREQLQRHRGKPDYVPEKVFGYIEMHRLYHR